MELFTLGKAVGEIYKKLQRNLGAIVHEIFIAKYQLVETSLIFEAIVNECPRTFQDIFTGSISKTE